MADAEFDIVDNSQIFVAEMIKKKAKALEMVGLVAEGYAKRLCAVDTGRLRNSITHATKQNLGPTNYTDNNGTPYSDAVAKTTPESDAVYIGTNVEYAPYVEIGTVRTAAQPYLRPAAADHMDQYRSIIKRVMKGEL